MFITLFYKNSMFILNITIKFKTAIHDALKFLYYNKLIWDVPDYEKYDRLNLRFVENVSLLNT